ncbi:uncharacterized protein LOC107423184 [Ziziphus jujuba]|uniref:Uncharacterized protein LOC107423184 n=1 Tax=Ziziphus jujuba TaxID=326968 RepID=A0A6P4A3J4_ZIZJJ|nr:uncharacterized protein LOC107423184 [Ziziphus jujuba]
MAETLFELEQVLLAKKEKLTPQEANILLNCRSKAVKNFTVGALVGAGIGWTATPRLSRLLRVYLSGGAAAFLGLWRFGRSLNSCVDHILELDGSRIQRELANIMATKHGDDPWIMQLMSRRFYSEKVYDDSTSDQPKIRWRYRNFYSDDIINGQRTHENDSHSNFQGDSRRDSQINNLGNSQSESSNTRTHSRNNSDKRRINLEPNQAMSSGIDVMADPLDCLFGYPGTKEEVNCPNTSTTTSRMHTRNRKRSHRRHRMRHHDDSLDAQVV